MSYTNNVASTVTVQNVPVQAQFDASGNCLGLVGPAGVFFSPPLTSDTIIGATIDNSVIGGTTPAATTGTTIYATAEIGYSTAAQGAVTQLTSKSTGVTLNKSNGQITMNNALLANGAIISFMLTNSLISARDVVIVNVSGGAASASSYISFVGSIGTGTASIGLYNISGGGLSEAVVLNYAIIHGQ